MKDYPLQYPAVAIGEPAGKPIRYCLRVNVRLTFLHPDDREILKHSGAVEFRKVRICRFAQEAMQQGGLLSYEELVFAARS